MLNKTEQNGTNRTIRNTLAVGVFGGAVLGFQIAPLLGALNLSGEDSATDWISAITAVAAALISGLAVVLVAQTLKATREMITETVATREEQKRIGDLQTRAWLSYDRSEVRSINNTGIIEVLSGIKNYGATPARNVKQSCQAFRLLLPKYFDVEDEVEVELKDLPPTKGITSTTGLIEKFDNCTFIIKVTWAYDTISGEADGDSIFLIIKEIDGRLQAEPLTRSDFYELDERYECRSKSILRRHFEDNLVEVNSQISE